MRAKLKIITVTKTEYGQDILKFSAVSASKYSADGTDENNTFAKFTPCATMEMHITNPELLGKFQPGDEFYVDFTKVEKSTGQANP